VSSIRNLVRKATYHDSVHNRSQLPPDSGTEVAIAGRSNAGKSSLINRLCNRKALARTSRTPGRTRQLVFFDLTGDRWLVDLPGYGYARVSGDMQRHWHKLIEQYLDTRQALKGLVIVMDIRHPLKEGDVQLANWAAERHLPCHLVLTKADKLGRGKMLETVRKVQAQCGEGITVQAFSAESGFGLEPLETILAEWFGEQAPDGTP